MGSTRRRRTPSARRAGAAVATASTASAAAAAGRAALLSHEAALIGTQPLALSKLESDCVEAPTSPTALQRAAACAGWVLLDEEERDATEDAELAEQLGLEPEDLRAGEAGDCSEVCPAVALAVCLLCHLLIVLCACCRTRRSGPRWTSPRTCTACWSSTSTGSRVLCEAELPSFEKMLEGLTILQN